MMPQSIEAWSQQQWGVFVTVLAAGLLAALLVNIRMRMLAEPAPTRAVGRVRVDPTADVLAHVAPGPGSLSSLREVGPGRITEPEPLVDADVRADLDAALSAALETFRVAVEPAMRTARLWTLQAGETYAENALRTWHIMEITSEHVLVAPR